MEVQGREKDRFFTHLEQTCLITWSRMLNLLLSQIRWRYKTNITESFKLETEFLGVLHTLWIKTIKTTLIKKESRLYIKNCLIS